MDRDGAVLVELLDKYQGIPDVEDVWRNIASRLNTPWFYLKLSNPDVDRTAMSCWHLFTAIPMSHEHPREYLRFLIHVAIKLRSASEHADKMSSSDYLMGYNGSMILSVIADELTKG